ncbi:MAG: branched-chain amino acid ABC transporter permease [Thermoanaerobacteraceae bacterium]|nr:branched-chain amino acid ABC transporter permease [Thermoanaerobacteraceae bacterium]
MDKNSLKKDLIVFAAVVIFYALVQVFIQTGIIGPYYSLNLILMCINIMLAVSLNLINGFLGQFSIGHAGLMSVGAYTSAILTYYYDLPLVVALIVGALAACLAGLVVAIPTLRLKGDYLGIATLGFGEIIRVVFLTNETVGGAKGFFGIPKLTTWTWAFFLMVLTIIVIKNFIDSSYGRSCIAIREDEIAAEAMGINTTKYKILAFTIGAFFAGAAGALYAHNFYTIQPEQFNFMKSFDIMTMVVLGGQGSITGSIIGAIAVTVLNAALSSLAAMRMVFYSLLLIIMMLFRPQGLFGTTEFTLDQVLGRRGRLGKSAGNKASV